MSVMAGGDDLIAGLGVDGGDGAVDGGGCRWNRA